MRFFIRRKNKSFHISVVWSTLFLMSAYAMSVGEITAKDNKAEKAQQERLDSIFTSRYVFENIHTSALEILTRSSRLDMLDYWDVDSIYKASNVMEGLSWLETVTPNYLKVRITAVSTYEIKILSGKNGKIAMTIYTVGDDVQAQDSQLKFYDERLRELPLDKYIELPQIKNFFEIPKGSATKLKEIEQMIPFPTMSFTANPENDILEARLTVEQYINQDDWNIAKLFVKPFITFEWKKDKYHIMKSN